MSRSWDWDLQMGSESLSKTVADALLERIRQQEFRPGDKLPTVQQLMAQYGVGRNTVREAMTTLVTLGIIDVRPRRGATVLSSEAVTALPSATLSALLGDQTVWDLYEVRLLLEVAGAGMAAKRRTVHDLDNIGKALTHFGVAYELGEPIWEADIEFHQAIAVASGNSVFGVLLTPVSDLLISARRATGAIPEAATRALHEHREIAEAITAGQVRAAKKAMEKHIHSGMWALRQLQESGEWPT